MLRTFNMGVGLTIVCAPQAAEAVCSHVEGQGCACYPIGTVVEGDRKVAFRGAVSW